jgi:2-dehydro-3-deoxygalactonokinase
MNKPIPELSTQTSHVPQSQVLCCDWGTSSFRLQLLNAHDYQCIGEVHSSIGVSATFNHWKTTGEPSGISRESFFRDQLTTKIDQLAAELGTSLIDVPLVLSGMASSSIGMAELPYAVLPFPVDGSQGVVRRLASQPDFRHEMLLISGVRSQDDVMRGEETQLIGVLALLDASGEGIKDAICLFPGTHSKHLHIQNQQLTHFETYMTGELFDLMAHQSILANSIDTSALSVNAETDIAIFQQAVNQSTTSEILNSLFRVRTNSLFNKLTKKQNALYLSGLLIGAELQSLREKESEPIVLCSGRKLSAFYQLAFDELGLAHRSLILPADLVDKAASVGQIQLFQNQPTQ